MKFNKVSTKTIFLFIIFLIISPVISYSQNEKLFSEDLNLSMEMAFDFKELYKNTNDSTYIKTKLKFSSIAGVIDSMDIRIRARGNFRKKICYFKPMKIKIKKKQAENTIFEKNRTLKLVVPCQNGKNKDELIYKELMAYKFYENLSDIYLKTQPITLKITEIKGSKRIEHTMFAFLVEDNSKVAKRAEAKKFPNRKVSALAVSDSSAINFAFFSYMIGNTDWSLAYQHNVEMLYLNNRLIAIPYDFDHSGLVNASYAKPNPVLGTTSVTQRVYRGLCKRDPNVFQGIRQHYLNQYDKIQSTISAFQNNISEKDYNRISKYIEDYYKILRSDDLFKKNILDKCRG
tara:strand:+ start:429 stop:1463 length:1035 start_codon:yes stop_codon:yes gene_type:complete